MDKIEAGLTFKDVLNKSITWHDLAQIYKPGITDKEVEYILWNETCYPFHAETTFNQLVTFLKSINHE